jgi:LmbE family N-acetylglucosaminyl deacetylase
VVTTAGDFLAAAEALPLAGFDAIDRPGGLLVVVPHPDDESLGCGGLIAEAAARGKRVAVVMVSDGVASHNNSRRFPPDARRALRRGEAEAALEILGLPASALHPLDLPDAAVPDHGPAFDRAVDAIVAAARAVDAGTLVTTWGHDPHCDHRASFLMAQSAMARLPGAALWSVPVWGHTLPPRQELPLGAPRGLRLDMAQHLSRKDAAIRAHRSQMGLVIDDDPEGFALPEAMLAHFARPFEILLQENP